MNNEILTTILNNIQSYSEKIIYIKDCNENLKIMISFDNVYESFTVYYITFKNNIPMFVYHFVFLKSELTNLYLYIYKINYENDEIKNIIRYIVNYGNLIFMDCIENLINVYRPNLLVLIDENINIDNIKFNGCNKFQYLNVSLEFYENKIIYDDNFIILLNFDDVLESINLTQNNKIIKFKYHDDILTSIFINSNIKKHYLIIYNLDDKPVDIVMCNR